MQDAKRKLSDPIVALWLRLWLKRVGKKYPDFFNRMMQDLDLPEKAIEVMKLQYVERKKFKEIPSIVNTEERNVYRLHKYVIDKIIHL